ncbi:MAG TPA: hypothetical protein ENJ82_04530, partial [Bacteroidetes bacterium]|nr:hypothetical protein [Bacteroidota bacterium]
MNMQAKRLILFPFFLFWLSLSILFAQAPKQDDDGFSLRSGATTAEVNLSYKNGLPGFVLNNYLDQVRLRVYEDNTNAYRISFGFGTYRQSKVDYSVPGQKVDASQYVHHFSLAIGAESQFKASERLKPYLGFEIRFATQISGFDATIATSMNTSTVKIRGASDLEASNRGFFFLDLMPLIGIDYYFTKRMYLGSELGFP